MRSDDEIRTGGDFEVSSSGKNPAIFRLENGKRIRIRHPNALRLVLPTSRVLALEAKYFAFPLFVGKRWDTTFSASGKWLRPTTVVTAVETLAIPTGALRAFKIERIIAISHRDGNVQYRRYRYYYSPETRSVVKYSYLDETKFDGPQESIDIELIKYQVGARNRPHIPIGGKSLSLESVAPESVAPEEAEIDLEEDQLPILLPEESD